MSSMFLPSESVIKSEAKLKTTDQNICIYTITNKKLHFKYTRGTKNLNDIKMFILCVIKYKLNNNTNKNMIIFSINGKSENDFHPYIQKSAKFLDLMVDLHACIKIIQESADKVQTLSPFIQDEWQEIAHKFDLSLPDIIKIKLLTGKIIVIHAEINSITTMELKIAIKENEGIQPDQQRLIYNGRQISDENLISDYGISNNSVICLILTLRGGMYHEISSRNGINQTLENNYYDLDLFTDNLPGIVKPIESVKPVETNNLIKVNEAITLNEEIETIKNIPV